MYWFFRYKQSVEALLGAAAGGRRGQVQAERRVNMPERIAVRPGAAGLLAGGA
jgi:hypothetical protein